MKMLYRLKVWLARVTNLPSLTDSVLRDRLNQIKIVGQLTTHTKVWKSKTSKQRVTSSGLVRQFVRQMSNSEEFVFIDAYSPICFDFSEKIQDINSSLYGVKVCNSSGVWVIIPCKLLINYDERELYLVSDELVEDCASAFWFNKVQTSIKQ